MAETLNDTVTSPPQTLTEPITVEEAEIFIGVTSPSPADASHTAEIESFIIASRMMAETVSNRDIIGRQRDKTMDCFPCGPIYLRAPLSSVELVQYRTNDGTTVTLAEGTDYVVDTARALIVPYPGRYWPMGSLWPSSAILVRFTTAGETNYYQRVGMLQLISDWYNDRLPYSRTQQETEGIPRRLRVLLAGNSGGLL